MRGEGTSPLRRGGLSHPPKPGENDACVFLWQARGAPSLRRGGGALFGQKRPEKTLFLLLPAPPEIAPHLDRAQTL